MQTERLANKIKIKTLYVKLSFIIDRENPESKPVFKRVLHRLEDDKKEEFDVFDSSTYHAFTQYNDNIAKDEVVKWEFTSKRGQVDALQLYPFDADTYKADPAKRAALGRADGKLLLGDASSLLVTGYFYNGFQRIDGEWAGVRANENADFLRLTVDFSSVLTKKNQKLFLQEPIATWNQEVKKQKDVIPMDLNQGRIYSAFVENPLEGDTIIFNYKMNWDSLFTSFEAHAGDSTEIPLVPFGGI